MFFGVDNGFLGAGGSGPLHAVLLWPHGAWMAARVQDGSDAPLGLAALAALLMLLGLRRHTLRIAPHTGWLAAGVALTLLSTVMLELPQQLGLFTIILLVHNTFGAMQDVAIDALACNTLHEDERGLANGMMFSGATIGTMIGGSGVLFLSGVTGFQPTFYFVTACILAVTALVVLPMKEAAGPTRTTVAGSRLAQAGREMHSFAVESFRSFLGTRGAYSGLFFSLLPAGAMCLGLALQSNLAVELGMDDDQVAMLGLWSSVLGALFCVAGGYLSDRYGRRKTLAIYLALMSLPVFYLMNEVTRHGWIMPISTTAASSTSW